MSHKWASDPGGLTFEEGEKLGCPDCEAGEPHCCPFSWANIQAEPARSWVLVHMRGHLDPE